MSKGQGLKEPMPALASRRSLALQCYRDIIQKYGRSETPPVIMERYKDLMSGGMRTHYASFKAEDKFISIL